MPPAKPTRPTHCFLASRLRPLAPGSRCTVHRAPQAGAAGHFMAVTPPPFEFDYIQPAGLLNLQSLINFVSQQAAGECTRLKQHKGRGRRGVSKARGQPNARRSQRTFNNTAARGAGVREMMMAHFCEIIKRNLRNQQRAGQQRANKGDAKTWGREWTGVCVGMRQGENARSSASGATKRRRVGGATV